MENKKDFDLDEKNSLVSLKINPEIYPLDVIYSAAYVFLDRAYVLLDGDVKKEVIVILKLKNKTCNIEDLENLGREFFNELLSYAFYKKQAEKNYMIRQSILQRALATNLEDVSICKKEDICEEKLGEEEFQDLDDIGEVMDDPDGIAIPWEEKYGKEGEKK